MPDDNTLKILIQLGVIGEADAEATKQLLKETGGAASDLGKETESTGKKAEEANHHHNNSRMLYMEMNRLIPGLGHAMHAMHSGALAPAIGFLMALDGIVKLMEEEKKKAEEAATANADIFNAGFEAQAGAIGKVRELSSEFSRAVQESGKAVQKILDEEQSKEEAVLGAKLEGEKKIRAARMESEILAAGDDKAKISGIRDRYKLTEELSGLTEEGAKIALLEKYKTGNQQLAGSFGAQAKSAESALEDFTSLASDPAANEEKRSQLAGKIKTGSKEFKGESDIFQTAKTFDEYRQMAIEHPDDKMAVAGYQSLKEKGEKAEELWRQMEEYRALTQEITDHAAELKRLQEQVKTTEEKFKAATDAVQRLTAQIDSAKAVQTVHEATASVLAPTETANAAARQKEAASKKISAAAEAEDWASHGHKLSESQNRAYADMAMLFAAHAGGIAQMQAIIKEHLRRSTSQAQEITALQNALKTLQENHR